MKNKRDIKGVKDTHESYTGTIVGIIKKVMALVLALGMIITAKEALELFNKWRESRVQETGIEAKEDIKKVSFEDVKAIVEEYREAKRNNDTEKMKALDMEVSKGNYINVLFEEAKEQVVESLGLDPEIVEVLIARDGVFLVDKEKANKYATVDHTGQINNRVKYFDENGKNPPIPYKIKNMIIELGEAASFARYKKAGDLEFYYSDFEYIEEYEPEVVDIGDGERE